MAKKTFLIFLCIQLAALSFAFMVKFYQPQSPEGIDISEFPLQKGGWIGINDNLIPEMVRMLNPTAIFSATFTNENGANIHLFFDYFESRNSIGGPHSPRNCMPGSGWTIMDEKKRRITVNSRSFEIGRFDLGLGESKMVMDFWYITRYGETANDFTFKLYSMISSLTFNASDMVFVRLLTNGDPASIKALEDFEQVYVEEIYRHTGFE